MEINTSSLSYLEANNLKRKVADITGQLLCGRFLDGWVTGWLVWWLEKLELRISLLATQLELMLELSLATGAKTKQIIDICIFEGLTQEAN